MFVTPCHPYNEITDAYPKPERCARAGGNVVDGAFVSGNPMMSEDGDAREASIRPEDEPRVSGKIRLIRIIRLTPDN